MPLAVAELDQLYVPWYGLVVSAPPPVRPVIVGNVSCLIPDSASELVPVTVKLPVLALL